MTSRTHGYLAAVALLAVTACKEDAPPPRREPPPPAPKAATCGGEAKVNDPKAVAYFPGKAGNFCLDPNGSDKAYGADAGTSIDEICNLFDGECEIYKRHDVDRVVEARYVDGSGSGATIDVYLSRYESTEKAYAMFTKRVVGDGDPAHPDTPRPIEGGGVSALGIGNAYLWRGKHLAEITFNDTSAASADDVKKKADAILPGLVKAFGAKLPGEAGLPTAAARLPKEQRLPLGLRFVTDELLGVKGTGAGAFGYYRDGEKRWRTVAIVKTDAATAKDVMKSFGGLEGAAKEKGIGEEAVRVIVSYKGPEAEWLLARQGETIVGIGDESRVLRDGMSPDEHRKKTLSQEDKRERLGAMLKPAEKE